MEGVQNLIAGWIGMLAGAVNGAAIGLFFHRAEWMGGYGSFRRRMLRLAHIAWFGIGFLNILLALSVGAVNPGEPYLGYASAAFLVALATMPACCLLAAWRMELRHLLPVPAIAVSTGVGSLLVGWWTL